MNFKYFQPYLAASAAIATLFCLELPAQAMSFFSFNGDARLENSDAAIGQQSVLNFYGLTYTISDSSETVNAGQAQAGRSSQVAPSEAFDIKDLVLLRETENRWVLPTTTPEVNRFLVNFETSTNLSYDLSRFVLIRDADGSFDAEIEGILRDGNTILNAYNGSFSSQKELTNPLGTTFSANLEEEAVAVPAPGMLPGLASVALAMMRKRKQAGQ